MIRRTRDNRTVLSGKDYTALRYKAWLREDRACGRCKRSLEFSEMELHHLQSRGLGGSKRSDVLENVLALCNPCHRAVSPQPQWTPKNKVLTSNPL